MPKRLYSLSEAELRSSIDSADDTAACSGRSSEVQDGAAWNTTHNSDCSMSLRDSEHSSTSTGLRSLKHGTAKVNRDSLHEGKGKGGWLFDPDPSKRSRIDSEAEGSEVTFEKNQKWHAHEARTPFFGHNTDGEAGFVNARHVSSRRDTGYLNSTSQVGSKMDGSWLNLNDGYGHCVISSRQMERSGMLYGASQGRDKPCFSSADETVSSCGESTEDSFIGEERSGHVFFNSCSPACRESPTTSPSVHIKGDLLSETKAEERIGCTQLNRTERHYSSEDFSRPPFVDKGVMEAPCPSYVLSSGRLSLEEEARLGRRAPTIDHDFEEYFSSLML